MWWPGTELTADASLSGLRSTEIVRCHQSSLCQKVSAETRDPFKARQGRTPIQLLTRFSSLSLDTRLEAVMSAKTAFDSGAEGYEF